MHQRRVTTPTAVHEITQLGQCCPPVACMSSICSYLKHMLFRYDTLNRGLEELVFFEAEDFGITSTFALQTHHPTDFETYLARLKILPTVVI